MARVHASQAPSRLGTADSGVGGFFARLANADGEFFFDGRKTLKDFVKPQRHVADGIGLRQHGGGQSRLENQKFRVAEHGGESVVDVGAHLDHVASESGLGLGGGADFPGFEGARLGLNSAKDFASD